MSNDHDETTGDGTTPESGNESSAANPEEIPDQFGRDELSADESDDMSDDMDESDDMDGSAMDSADRGRAGLPRIADEMAELQDASVGARVSAGSARAAARASAVRAGTTAAKGKATPVRDRAPKRANIFVRIGRFLREVVAELGKVIWPTSKEYVTYTIVVMVFLVFMVGLVYGLDLLFAQGVLKIFG